MVGGDRGGDVLQQHRLAGLRRGDDQAALALADRRDQIDGARGQVLGGAVAALELQALGRVKGRQVLEQHLVARAVRRVEIDLADLQQREVALTVLGRTDQAGDRIAGAQVEAADLARADVDVVGAGQVGAVGRAQEAKAVLQDLEHAVAVDVLAVARVRLEDREDDVLLARAGEVLEAHRLGELHQLVNRLDFSSVRFIELTRLRQLCRAYDLGVVGVERLRVMHHVIGASATVAVAVAAVAVTIAVARAFVGAVAALVAEVASHLFACAPGRPVRLLSRNAASCDLDTAPTFWASTVPFLNRISVGMPRMPNFGGVCGFSSILILAILQAVLDTRSRSHRGSGRSSCTGRTIRPRNPAIPVYRT